MNIILRGQGLRMAPRDIAREIRPLIGLTDRQAQANQNYREKVYQKYLDSGLSETKAAARAEKAALKYAGKQLRYRAETIVLTENAFAYNRGKHMGVCQAIADGLMGRCAMIWTTAGTNRVCGRCLALKDTVVGYTDELGVTLPPLHPRCRCSIMYDEKETPRARRPKPKPSTPTEIKEKHETLTNSYAKLETQWRALATKIHEAAQAGDDAKYRKLEAESLKIADELFALDKELKAIRVEGAKQKVIFTTGLKNSGYYTDEIEAISALISENAPEDFRLVWNLNEKNIKVLNRDYRSTPHYVPLDRGINLDSIEDRMSVLQKPFKTLCHEAGHLIDHAIASYTHFSSTGYLCEGFADALQAEGKEYLKATLTRLKREAVESGKSAKNIKITDAQKAVSKELYNLELVNRREVSDIWDGLTKGKVNGGFGHGTKYWRKSDALLPAEAFAHMFCATIQNPENVCSQTFK